MGLPPTGPRAERRTGRLEGRRRLLSGPRGATVDRTCPRIGFMPLRGRFLRGDDGCARQFFGPPGRACFRSTLPPTRATFLLLTPFVRPCPGVFHA